MSDVDFRSGASALESPKAVPSALEVSSHWKSAGSALVTNIQAVQNASVPAEQWSGQTAKAVAAEIKTMGGKVSSLAEKFPSPAGALETWNGQVNTAISEVQGLQQQWNEALRAYCDEMERIDAKAAADEDYDPEPDRRKARTQIIATQSELKGSYDKKITALSDAASDAAKTINDAINSVIAPEAVKAGRSAVGAALFGSDTPIVDSAAEWQFAQEIAPKIAAGIKKEPMTAAEVRAFNEKYGHYLSNPYIAAAVSEYVSVDDINKAALSAYKTGFDEYGVTVDSSYERFNKNLGSLLVMSTGGSNLSREMADSQASFTLMSEHLVGKDGAKVSQIIDTKLAELKTSGRELYTHPATGLRSEKALYGYDIFGQLAGVAAEKNPSLTLGSGFYDQPTSGSSVFADMVKWDHDTNKYETALTMTTSMEEYQLFGSRNDESDMKIAQRFDPLQSVIRLSNSPDRLNEVSQVLQEAEEGRLSALRKALDTNIDFDPSYRPNRIGQPYSGDEPMSMARYLSGWRGGAQNGQHLFYDSGEAFGEVIADASRPAAPIFAPDSKDFEGGADSEAFKEAEQKYESWKEDARRRASVAANVMAGYQNGLDHKHSDVKGENIFGYKNSALRSWMGSIIEPYVYDLASEMHSSTDSGMNAGAGPDVYDSVKMKFGRPLIDRFKQPGGLLQDLAFDRPKVINDGGTPDYLLDDKYEGGRKPALQVVQTAAYRGYMGDVTEALQDANYHSRMDAVKGATNRWTELIQETFDANPEKNTAIGKALDESHRNARKIVEFIVDQSAGYAGKQVPVAGPLVTTAIKSAAGAGLDWALSTNNEMKGWESHYEANLASNQLMQNGLVRAMYDSDQWTERAGAVDVSPGTQAYADKKLPALNSDGTRRAFWSLDSSERDQVRNYFTGKNSDFRALLDDQYNAQQNAQDDGRVEKPSSGGK